MKTNTIPRLIYRCLIPLITLALFSCTPPKTTPTSKKEEGYVELNVASTVKCLIQQVYSGMSAPLARMNLNELKSLQANGKVTTDSAGEAQIDITGCGYIWVFRDTQLEKATCRQSAYETSHAAYCLTGGTSGVQHNCLLKMTVQTPNISVETGGTGFTVSYFPEQQLSLVIAIDGTLQVQSFANLEAGVPPVTLQQAVWFDDPQGNYPLLQPYNNQPIPYPLWRDNPDFNVLKTGQLQDWLIRTQARFNEADYFFPPEVVEGWSSPVEQVLPGFHFSGELFANPAVWEAVQLGIPWQEVWGFAQPDPAVRPQLTALDREPVDPFTLSFNIDQARSLLKEAALDDKQRTVLIVFSANEPRMQESARILAEYLASIGFVPEFLEIDPANLKEVIQVQTMAGRSTVWIQP
jgi:hypothetical protein